MRGVEGVSVDGVVFTDGIRLRQASIDHVVPRTRGGSNRPSNLITCCVECNAKRGDLSVPAFADKINWSCAPVIVRRVRAAQKRKLLLSIVTQIGGRE